MERTMSMRSFAGSDASAGGKPMSLADIQAIMSTMGGGRGRARDDASDTSSQRERKFAAMLGDDGAAHDLSPGGQSGPHNVGDRLFIVGCGKERMKKERLREERDRQLMHEMAQMTQRPNITNRARTRPGKGHHFSEHAMMWDQRRRDHQADLARQRRLEVHREVTGTPSLEPRSREILEHRGTYASPVDHWQEHFARFCAKRAAPMSPENLFNPNINANAVRADTDVTIADRLYSEHSTRRERRQKAAEEARQQELIDTATGRPLFTPQSLGQAKTNRSVEELSQQLYEDRALTERKRKSAEEHRDPEMTFRPQLNPSSQALAAKSPRKPLYDPKRQQYDTASNRSRSVDDGASPAAKNVKANVGEFLQRTARADLGRASRIAAIKAAIDEKETSECTFQPRINSKSEQIFQATNLSGAPLQSPMAVLASPFQEIPAAGADGFSPAQRSARRALSPNTSGGPRAPGFVKLSRAAANEMEAAMLAADVVPGAGGPHTPHTHSMRSNASRSSPTLPPTSRAHGTQRSHHGPPQSSPAPDARAASPGGRSEGSIGSVDHYIQAFERQMYAVLDEWRRLEEV